MMITTKLFAEAPALQKEKSPLSLLILPAGSAFGQEYGSAIQLLLRRNRKYK
jgi:hypothetical protein